MNDELPLWLLILIGLVLGYYVLGPILIAIIGAPV